MKPLENPVLVLGGGIAGITATLELTRLGHTVILAEKGPFLGGRAAHFTCKATDTCQKCGACLVEQCLLDLFAAPRLKIETQSQLIACRRENGRFRCTLKGQPLLVDPKRCINCSLCASECPAAEAGAVMTTSQVPHHPRYAILPEHCLHFLEGSCRVCADLCPTGAIDLNQRERELDLTVAAVVLATGYQPADPRELSHYGYGYVPGVITGVELENLLRHGFEQLFPGGGRQLSRVAFIQCVGSRNHRHPYCSRVCCAYTLRLARLIKHRRPDCQVTTFYMDLQNVGQTPGKFLAAVQEEITTIRALPGIVAGTAGGTVKVRYVEESTGQALFEEFDLVVLAVGMGAGQDNRTLGSMLRLELTPERFFQPADAEERATTGQPGVFLAGAALGPLSIPESIAQATAAAWRVHRYLEGTCRRAPDPEQIREQVGAGH
ncbi:MAG: FAD-dependent oxidoreductase [Thermodesulfobacteriota bacterium]